MKCVDPEMPDNIEVLVWKLREEHPKCGKRFLPHIEGNLRAAALYPSPNPSSMRQNAELGISASRLFRIKRVNPAGERRCTELGKPVAGIPGYPDLYRPKLRADDVNRAAAHFSGSGLAFFFDSRLRSAVSRPISTAANGAIHRPPP
jgi:hypothetical protein